ncbi:hypothetical protein FH593_20420 (plasmid) [Leptospira interrogans]|uniref:hypothetical protein n=1 Tax=Leptospira interrogans TaxID=173 RepID=UPI0002BEE456|nr:hypothetical protein [Leptospira interrogans]EMN60304.1 hypothetical protein LEP1GSC092_0041 [Leptospira interrogans serovar Pyrogenes str. R168]ULG90667.1 hypothetical protein FH593_20715 [Leptospira interrogans]ULG90696.1 hypothetical protein FH593_20420 [Leptospira interrogans]UML78404.1 hypothetical protein FH583_21675 [Leptospira interrogans]UML78460.1 hypothetical protein FH583_21525 [Leptospira interrogans]
MKFKIGERIDTPHGEGVIHSIEKFRTVRRVCVTLDKSPFDSSVACYLENEVSLPSSTNETDEKVCKVCNESYSREFFEDFIDGECFPCRSLREFEEDLKNSKIELIQFNKKHGTDYDNNSFYYSCYNREVKRSSLRMFPFLLETYNYAESIRTEIEQREYIEREPSLFDSDEDIPF